MLVTGLGGPFNDLIKFPVERSATLIIPSFPPTATLLLSGETAMLLEDRFANVVMIDERLRDPFFNLSTVLGENLTGAYEANNSTAHVLKSCSTSPFGR